MLFGTWSQAHAYDPSDYMETRLKTGVFLRLFTLMFTKESNYNPRFGGKSAPLWGIFNNYKEKLRVPRVETDALSLKQ